MPVRVTRIIAIEYPDYAAYEKDRALWQLPANGTHIFGDKIYKTACLDATTIGHSDGPEILRGP